MKLFKAFPWLLKGLTINHATIASAAPMDLSSIFGSPLTNSAVAAAGRFVRRTFPEAPFTLWREGKNGKDEKVTSTTSGIPQSAALLLKLLKRPNPQYSGRALLAMVAVEAAIEGNGYIRIDLDGYGLPSELWWLPSHCVKEVPDYSGYLKEYRVQTRAGVQTVPPERMIHVKDGIDPHCTLRGISDLKAAAREVLGDNKAAEYIAAVLENPAVGLLVTPEKDVTLPADEGNAIVRKLKQAATGAFRFGSIASSKAIKLTEFGITPDKMAITATRANAVERICSVLGFDPMVLSLPSQNKTFSNYQEARKAAYKSNILPLQMLVSEEFDASLKSLFPDLDDYWFGFDTSKIKELQEDENERWKRLGEAFINGGITRGEYRTSLGDYEADPKRDDIFFQEVASPDALPAKSMKALKDRIRDRRRVFEALAVEDAGSD